jgi:hypothetical protein
MKVLPFIPLLFLTACSATPPKLVLRPETSPSVTDAVRYPEIVHAYHFGRYVDPNDDLVMHGQQVIYRVEENSRWNLHPDADANLSLDNALPSNAAFSPLPVTDAELAEINAQKLATIQLMTEARTLSAAIGQFHHAWEQTETNLQETARLRTAISKIQKQMNALAVVQKRTQKLLISTTNQPDLLPP